MIPLIIIIVIVTAICIAVLLGLILGIFDNNLYCKIFERKSWKTWNYILQNIDNIRYAYSYQNTHVFFLPETKYSITVDKCTSVYDIRTGECYASPICKQLSQNVTNLLLEKLTYANKIIVEAKK